MRSEAPHVLTGDWPLRGEPNGNHAVPIIVAYQYSRGHEVAQFVDALLYNPEGRGFDSRWCHWNFSLT